MLKAETPSAAQKFVISADPTACFEIIYRDVICSYIAVVELISRRECTICQMYRGVDFFRWLK